MQIECSVSVQPIRRQCLSLLSIIVHACIEHLQINDNNSETITQTQTKSFSDKTKTIKNVFSFLCQ